MGVIQANASYFLMKLSNIFSKTDHYKQNPRLYLFHISYFMSIAYFNKVEYVWIGVYLPVKRPSQPGGLQMGCSCRRAGLFLPLTAEIIKL